MSVALLCGQGIRPPQEQSIRNVSRFFIFFIMNFSAESPENYEQKCCCALVVDVSSSMSGIPINQLNQALQEFHQDIAADSTTANRLEITVIEFCHVVQTLIDPSLVENFTMPILTTKGTTALVDGVREGINVVKARKAWYKQTGQPYYRPWVILITDGAPDAGQDVTGLAKEIAEGAQKSDFHFFTLGVQNANMSLLNTISDASMPPAHLQGLKFSEFFKWLSATMVFVSNSKDGDKINLPNPANWMSGFTV